MTETFQHATILPQISQYVDLLKLSKNHMSNCLYTDQFNLNQFNKIALLNFSAPKAITVTGGAAKEGKTSHALQR